MRPTPDQFRLAAEWLDSYEPVEDDDTDAGVSKDMVAVAQWLREQADAAELRATCRESGVSVTKVRKAMRRRTPAE